MQLKTLTEEQVNQIIENRDNGCLCFVEIGKKLGLKLSVVYYNYHKAKNTHKYKKYLKVSKKWNKKHYNKRKNKEKSTSGAHLNTNHRKLWTLREIEKLKVYDKTNLTDHQIHLKIGRSVSAIMTKRYVLKKKQKKGRNYQT